MNTNRRTLTTRLLAAVALGGGLGSTAPAAFATSSAASPASTNRLQMNKDILMSQSTTATPQANAPITIVLVHGAWAESASWSGVITALTAEGMTVLAPANPLRGLISDAEYLASFLDSIEGPILLVAHSYGGAVSSIAASSVPSVVGIVYVAAYALQEGETLLDIANQFPVETLGNALRQVPIAGGTADAPAMDVYLDRAQAASVFAQDVPSEMASVMVATQRPLIFSSFVEPAPSAAWQNLPTWALVATDDRTLGEATAFMAERAGSTITEIDASHAVLVSHPEAVVEVIHTALGTLS